MGFTNSPNMNLPVPNVGNEPGPNYAQDINNCMTLIDQHTHAPGSGVQITPSGLNINSNLTFSDNLATNLAAVNFLAQGSPPINQSTYVSGVDLHYVDGNGVDIAITNNGAVAGSPGSISNLTSPASASYVALSSTFVWQSNTNIAANMDFGAAIFRNLSPNSTHGVTVQPPAALASNYTLTLPSIPGSTSFVTLDTSGNLSGSISTSAGITSSNIAAGAVGTTQLASNAVTTVKITDGNVTQAKLGALNYAASASCGSFSVGSTSFVQISNFSVSLTTTGRPVAIQVCSDGTVNSNSGYFFGVGNVNTAAWQIRILRNGTPIAEYDSEVVTTTSSNPVYRLPSSVIQHFDAIGAGTYTYSIQMATFGAGSAGCQNSIMVAREL